MIDYGIPVPSQLLFNVGVSSLCIDISTTDDDVYEDDELFTVSLSSTSDNVDVSSSITTILITNNDGMHLKTKLLSLPYYYIQLWR